MSEHPTLTVGLHTRNQHFYVQSCSKGECLQIESSWPLVPRELGRLLHRFLALGTSRECTLQHFSMTVYLLLESTYLD